MPFSTKQKFAEYYRISFEESQEGQWLAELDKPLSVSMPLDQQQEHLFKHAYLAECNRAFAVMYGYSDPAELVGVRFPQLLILSDPENQRAVRSFLTSDYRVNNVQTHELAKNGEDRYFLNDVRGIVEKNFLVRFWGRQRDVTSDRRRALNNLTPQQATILKLTIEGKSLKEISHALGVGQKTVDTIRARLKRKLGASNIPHLAAKAVQLGLFDIGDKL
jgi:DNA-binding CsgD family transcriptional regulator